MAAVEDGNDGLWTFRHPALLARRMENCCVKDLRADTEKAVTENWENSDFGARSCSDSLEMEPMAGIEPATDGLRNRCSTAELHWLNHFVRN